MTGAFSLQQGIQDYDPFAVRVVIDRRRTDHQDRPPRTAELCQKLSQIPDRGPGYDRVALDSNMVPLTPKDNTTPAWL